MTEIEFLVPGGQATPGDPIGPQLGPTPVDVQQAVTTINEQTAAFDGVDVPITLTYEQDGSFEIEIGVPPTSALLKREAGIERGSGQPEDFVADLTSEQLQIITEQKQSDLNAYDAKNAAKEIAGTCVSLGITIDGNDPREFAHRVDAGEYEAFEAETNETGNNDDRH
jgi:large subunit ribosomal protein L11